MDISYPLWSVELYDLIISVLSFIVYSVIPPSCPYMSKCWSSEGMMRSSSSAIKKVMVKMQNGNFEALGVRLSPCIILHSCACVFSICYKVLQFPLFPALGLTQKWGRERCIPVGDRCHLEGTSLFFVQLTWAAAPKLGAMTRELTEGVIWWAGAVLNRSQTQDRHLLLF